MSRRSAMRVPQVLTAQECEALARRVLEMVTGSQAQVLVGSGSSSVNEFARGDTHMAAMIENMGVHLTVEVDGRHASGSTGQVDDASLRTLVRQVEALARQQRTPGPWTEDSSPPLRPPQVYPKGPRIFFDATVDAMAAEAQADLFGRVADAADAAGLVAASRLRLETGASGTVNTLGLWVYAPRSYGELHVMARTKDGTGSGWAWSGYEDWARVDVQELITRAVELARRSANPVAIEPGRYTVILEPPAVAELIDPIIGFPTSFWSAGAADGGGSVFSGTTRGTNKIGLQMMDRRLGMVSSPWDPERPASTVGSSLGAYLKPLSPVTWFENGVLKNLAYDDAYARERGRKPVYNPGGVRLAADGPAQTLDEMIASTRRGVWVNRLSHISVIDNRTLLLGGVTRDGTFLIENGKITKPIKNFRFTTSPFFALNQLEAWGEPVRASQNVVAPRLKVRDFNFSSLTDAV